MFKNLAALTVVAVLVPTANAAFPGGNGKIAFASFRDGNYEIYVMNADGSNEIRLTVDGSGDEGPTWSPDGAKILFSSFRDGDEELFVMNADGSNPIQLTSNFSADDRPAWSPDGTEILFASFRNSIIQIYRVNADGSGETPLTGGLTANDSPAWSPDGSRIAFSSERDGDPEIYVMNADGTNPVRLTTAPGRDDQPAWSPDGTRIVFHSARDASDSEIYTMNADGSNQIPLTNNEVNDATAAWSPDGTRIVFRTNLNGVDSIVSVNPDGSNPVTLSNGEDDDPDWQPVAPANDARAEARVIGQGQFPGALALATQDGSAGCVGGAPQPDIWYRYPVPMAGRLRVNTCGTNDLGVADAASDTVLSLHTADGLGELACNDDWPSSAEPAACTGTDAGLARDSHVQAYLPAGQDVLVRVSRYPNGGPLRAVVVNLDFLPDSDGDGVLDGPDNCTLHANPGQCDSDGDGYGNRCDGDFNDNQFTNAQDTTLFRQQLGQPSAAPAYNEADLNCNGFVNAQDSVLFRGLLGSPPGPSGVGGP